MAKTTQPLADAANAAAVHDNGLEKATRKSSDPKPETALREDVAAAGLEKVYQRHGRVDLDPMPSDSPDGMCAPSCSVTSDHPSLDLTDPDNLVIRTDPLNWQPWRKNAMLWLVAIHACMGPFAGTSLSQTSFYSMN